MLWVVFSVHNERDAGTHQPITVGGERFFEAVDAGHAFRLAVLEQGYRLSAGEYEVYPADDSAAFGVRLQVEALRHGAQAVPR